MGSDCFSSRFCILFTFVFYFNVILWIGHVISYCHCMYLYFDFFNFQVFLHRFLSALSTALPHDLIYKNVLI